MKLFRTGRTQHCLEGSVQTNEPFIQYQRLKLVSYLNLIKAVVISISHVIRLNLTEVVRKRLHLPVVMRLYLKSKKENFLNPTIFWLKKNNESEFDLF